MRIAVEHITRYSYASEASYAIQCLRMTPTDYAGQRTLDWRIETTPASTLLASRDGFGNVVHLVTMSERHREIEIRAVGTVEVEDRQGVVSGATESAPTRLFLRRTPLTTLPPAIHPEVPGSPATDAIRWLHALMAIVRDRVDYVPGATHAGTTADEAWTSGRGVCQDHAHIFVALARAAGVPARYVTGYLLLESESQNEAHHAWAEAWVDGLGWLGFDVANRLCPTDRYVRMAIGLDAASATPIRGSRRGGGEETLTVAVHVVGNEAGGAGQGMSQQ